MEVAISKNWKRDDGSLGPSACLACSEEVNGLNYGNIKVDDLKIVVNLCDACLAKLKKSLDL